jgi:NosR/NirI family transcriptional regulator, nitrous oxide reductase regulator
MPTRRPVLREHFESSRDGVFIVGDLAGAPVIKLALEQGEELAQHLAGRLKAGGVAAEWDVVVVGAGAAGLAVALRLHESGRRVLVLEKSEMAATFRDFPVGKKIYAEPVSRANPSALLFEESTKEELLERWQRQVVEAGIEIRCQEEVVGIADGAVLEVETEKSRYRTRFVVLASGVRGNPRKLGLAGEDGPKVLHKLYNPGLYEGKRILVVGGGNSAVEAAVALSGRNEVTLMHRGASLDRVFRENRNRLEASRVTVRLNEELQSLDVDFDQIFVLIGADAPAGFLKRLGIRLENEWDWKRWLGLVVTFALAYSIYGIKLGKGEEFWPYRGWGYEALSFFGRGWSFWYTVLYTAVVTIFGLQAMKRWGIDRKDKFQIYRFATLIGFQWTFFFLIPEFLFGWAVKYHWVGESLATDPNFANNAWRSYGIVYAWPLFFYTFFSNPHDVWIVWGVILSFVLLPVLVLLHGKRYCSWICGCGGLAETLGDRWRHLAPKGRTAIAWERMNLVVLGAAVVITVLMLGQDVVKAFREPAGTSIKYYRLVVDTWLVGILPVALYPFFGGKVWCRYWCPLAKMMELWASFYTSLRWSRFQIASNDKCIACGECTRNCQVGIDVMKYALSQQELNNENSSCIGCGICITVCPMDVLSFGKIAEPQKLIQISR